MVPSWHVQTNGNNGMANKEATDLVQDLNPNINRVQARNQLSKRVLPINAVAGILNAQTIKVQPTTGDYTNINVAQQYRWH